MENEIEVVEIEDIEDFLEAGSESDTFESEPYVAPTPRETIEWLQNLWDNAFDEEYNECKVSGNYWSADMQIEAHNQCLRDHLDSMVRSGVLSEEEAYRIYSKIEQ